MNKVKLDAKVRDIKAKVHKLKKGGDIPAVVYGHNIKNINLSIKKTEFEKCLKSAGESSIVDLAIEGEKAQRPVLIQDVQLHFLTNEPIHADFYQVSMTEKLKAHVALEFIGESPAVKAMGGILVKVMNEIEVQCLPADLPHNIQVDISVLTDFSQAIHIRDLKLGDKVQILANPEEVIAKVQPPRDVEAELAKTADEKSAVEAVVAASEKVKTPEETKDGAEEKTKEEKPKK
jgi:large subunit ribosomal protein L25